MDRPTTALFSYDDLSEDEDGGKEQARKDSIKLQEAAAMRCAQSLEDTEGLEEVAMFSDKILGFSSGFTGYRPLPGDHLLVSSSNGIHPEEGEDVPGLRLRGDISSNCGRGCCGGPWHPLPAKGGLVGGVEYLEEEFGLASAKRQWRSSSSREVISASVVQSLLLAKLKHRICGAGGGEGGGSFSSIMQEILAREISEQTVTALKARAHAQ